MTDMTELGQAAQDQFMNAYALTSNAILEGVRAFAESAGSLTPESIKAAVPGMDSLPNPTEATSLSFDFAQRLLDAQRDFASSLIAAAKPAQV